MSDRPVNIYSAIVFDLNKKVKGFIDQLNNDNQIDLDDDGYPYIVKVDRNGPNIVCHLVRNNKLENFILNSRKRKPPIPSWNPEDGFVRLGGKKVIAIAPSGDDGPKRERLKRTFESFERVVDQIFEK